MMRQHEDALSAALATEVVGRSRVVEADPEIAAIRRSIHAQFREAVTAAVATLDARDTTLYRMHLVEELTLERIAEAYQGDASKVLRWLRESP